MEQMVFVVTDDCANVIGAYNNFDVARDIAVKSEEYHITPVIVDKTDVNRLYCDTDQEVVEAMEYELSAQPDEGDTDEEIEEADCDFDEDGYESEAVTTPAETVEAPAEEQYELTAKGAFILGLMEQYRMPLDRAMELGDVVFGR